MISIRKAIAGDIIHLMDIDVKCYDTPLTYKIWGQLDSDPNTSIQVATSYKEPIGYVIFRKDVSNRECHIIRLAVKPHKRKRGIGTRLMEYVRGSARLEGLHQLVVLIPETFCDPSIGVGEWLVKLGFRVELPLIKDAVTIGGQNMDCVKFVGPVAL